MRIRLAVLVLAMLSAGGSFPAFADNVNFTDGTFNLANYTQTPVFVSSGATLTFGQCATCGNPGQALQMVSSFGVPGGTTAVGFAGNSFTYDPSTQGAIVSVDASADKNLTLTIADPGGTDTFRPMIEQDGNFYLAAISGPVFGTNTSTGYLTLSGTGLTAADFLQYDFTTGAFGAANPNFDGDAMTFGLGQIFGVNVGPEGFEADYDNLDIGLNTVPEPSSVLSLGMGLALLIGLSAKSRRRLLN